MNLLSPQSASDRLEFRSESCGNGPSKSPMPYEGRQCNRSPYFLCHFAVAALAFLAEPKAAIARDTPIHPVGPQVRGTLGLASSTSYRDLVTENGASPWASATLSYRGFSFSCWGSAQKDGGDRAFEAAAYYSHKLPLFDLHAGATRFEVSSPIDRSATALRLGLSSNVSPRFVFDAGFDRTIDESESLVSTTATYTLRRSRDWQIDGRLAATWWDRDNQDASGWSLRLLFRRGLNNGPDWVGFLGYASSAMDGDAKLEDGIVSGLSFTFR